MNIGQRTIARDTEPYIIAELGVNHDGSVDRALELTRAAAANGADAVKLQLYRTDMLMSKAAKLASYQKAAGETDPIAMLRRLELTTDEMERVVDLAHSLKVHAIVSVFSVELVAEAETLAWDAYKTASPDIINRPLLEALVATGKPLVVSTGASTLREIGRALDWLRAARERLAVMQCVSSYPTPIEQAELAGIRAIAEIFDGPVGYSDHTSDERTGAWAANMGACILEKHVTFDQAAQGPDHAASLTPENLAVYHDVIVSRHFMLDVPEAALGEGKRVLECEEDVRRVSRQSLVTTRDLSAGHRLTRSDLTIKRPGTGVEPFRLDEMLGKRLREAVEADVPLSPEVVDSKS